MDEQTPKKEGGSSRPSNHYIDNKEFYAAMIEWKKVVNAALENEEPKPPVTEYIGKCFLDIAEHLSYRPNFINYPYREEMIGDGIENCLMYASNFDPDKSKNPFSYFTQIIYFAFLRRIHKEKKQTYIKYRMIEATDIFGDVNRNLLDTGSVNENSSNPLADHFSLSEADIKKFTPKKRKKKTDESGNNK